jgi:hypothetical protein
MRRAWIATALLAGSWLLGLSYYELACLPAWIVLVAAGTLLMAGLSSPAPSGNEPRTASPPLIDAAAIVLMVPAVWFAPWPYRAAPLAIVAGLLMGAYTPAMQSRGFSLFPRSRGFSRVAGAFFAAGLVLLAQGVVLRTYAAQTARNHDLPWPAAELLAGLARLVGVDAAADGPMLVVHTLRQTHRLAVTWDLVLDPATCGFLFGGLVMLALAVCARLPAGSRWPAWLGAARRLAILVLAWLPLRTLLLVAVYLQRAMRSDPEGPPHVMNQFLSPWVHLALLAVPALAAWRWIRLRPLAASQGAEESPLAASQEPPAAYPLMGSLGWAGLLLVSLGLLAAGLQWQPAGARRQGRVMWVERHSTWEPTDRPYDTKSYSGEEEHSTSYTYTLAYQYLGQFYAMSRLAEQDAIDDESLRQCDVLVIKVPTARYSREEVDAVVRFVRSGGGLLLIGDHTNFDGSSATMNDITRQFGFTFRDDVLYSTEAAPEDYAYTAPRLPHPAVEHVPRFEFAVSCSIDPGSSRGRTVIEGTRLWSMPPEYHNANYMPYARHRPEMRCGAFVQAWAAHPGAGRVLAFADSTFWSSFSIYQPGNAELLLNLVEWLNHQDPAVDPAWFVLALGTLGLAAVAWRLARGLKILDLGFQIADHEPELPNRKSQIANRKSQVLLLVAAGCCGWAAGSAMTEAVGRWAMPLPAPERPLLRVVIDRTVSQAPLAKGAYNEDKQGQGFGLLEQWIPRLGYMTVRAAGQEATSGDALVVICPSLPPDAAYQDRLVRYVAEGGRLLVLDAGEGAAPSTANSLLRPFGLQISYEQNWQGELAMADGPGTIRAPSADGRQSSAEQGRPRNVSGTLRVPIANGTRSVPDTLHVDHAWEVLGGRRVASLGHQRTIAAEARYGKGLVLAVGFGNLFNDAHMGMDWSHDPDEKELLRYQALFALLRLLTDN